jgi:hypothetical protein
MELFVSIEATIGAGEGIAAVISPAAWAKGSTLTCQQIRSTANDHASAATTANDTRAQPVHRSPIMPIPPRN